MPHVLEPSYVDTQLLSHKRFIWLHPHFMVRADDHESILLPHPSVQFSRIFVNFTAGRRLQLIPAAGPRDHMPLTMDLVTNGIRHCPDPTRGRWDHEKIEEMLSDPVARLTFFKEHETQIRNSSIVGIAATEATPDDAWEKPRADNSGNSWSLLSPGCATTHSAACFGTKTSTTGTWSSTTSDRLLMRLESCEEKQRQRSHVWRKRCVVFLVGS